MKKFLTMLLALSVVFTYTFGAAGSVFATDNTEAQYLANLNTAKTNVIAVQKAEYDKAVITVNTTGDVKDTSDAYGVISKANWLAQLEVEYAAIIANINTKAATLETSSEYTAHKNDTVAELGEAIKALVSTVPEATILTNLHASDGAYAAAAAKAQFPVDKAAAIANAKSVDTTIYSETKLDAPISFNGKTYDSHKAYADAVVAKVVADITAVELADTDTTAALIGKKMKDGTGSVKAAFDAYIKANLDGKYVIDETKCTEVSGDILSKTEEDAINAGNAATVAAKKATIASNIASAYSKVATLSADQIAAYTSLKKAYESVETALVEKNPAHSVGNFPTYTASTPSTNEYTITKNPTTKVYEAVEGTTKYQAIVKAIADNTALATTIKAMKDSDGNVTYDATKVDKKVASTTDAYYENINVTPVPLTLNDFSAAKLKYYTAFDKSVLKENLATLVDVENMTITANASAITVNHVDVVAAKALADTNAVFYAKEWAQVEAIINTCNAAIDAAKTTAEAEKAIADAKTAIAALNDKSEVAGLYASDTKLAEALTAAQKAVAKYVANANYGVTDVKKQITYNDAKVKTFLMENGARTAADVTALNDKLMADVAAAKTPEQVATEDQAAADAVVAIVKTIPTQLNITLANKETILTAEKEYNKLTEAAKEIAANPVKGGITGIATVISTAKTTVKGLENAAITAAIEAITKPVDATKVTLANKDAVKAIEKSVNKFAEDFGEPATNAAFITGAQNALTVIRALELKAIQDSIKALPTEITTADKATVEAIRAAIDAYVAEYTDAKAGDNAAEDISAAEYVLLATAEASVKYTDKDVKSALFDMSRKVTIWRTSKTSIRVTAVGSVADIKDNGYTVKYSFYKKAPGAKSYKPIKTTTSNKYTYTNLKKGTNKFQVKVNVYDAEGKLVASKWTYYRAAKVK